MRLYVPLRVKRFAPHYLKKSIAVIAGNVFPTLRALCYGAVCRISGDFISGGGVANAGAARDPVFLPYRCRITDRFVHASV